MPRPKEYLQPINWKCWANVTREFRMFDGAKYQAVAMCNEPAEADIGLCKRCYVDLVGEWPPVSGKMRPNLEAA